MSIIFVLFFLLSCISSTSSTKDDEITLLKIKKQLGDPDILSSWFEGFDFCNAQDFNYWGISCASTGRVNSLAFHNLNFTTPFPEAICDLTELQYLTLYEFPGLYGPIPSCITQLFNLNILVIIDTSLSGAMPIFINHTNLFQIILRGNHLSGTIPPSLSTLSNLNSLALSSNYLTGTIPPSLSMLPNLNYLDLSSNYLNGTIPPSLSTLQNLQYLYLSSNNLTGTIPSGLVHGSSAMLNLSKNSLTGELPRCYGWVDLSVIDVGNNQLSGDASFLFGKQKSTDMIVLANNEFEFDLSYVEIREYMFRLDLSHNKIYGKIPDSFKSAIFYDLDLSFNKLCGEIPQGDNMWKFNATVFANNTCLCGYPLAACSTSAPAQAPILEASFDSSP